MKLHDLAVCLSFSASAFMVAWPLWSICEVLWELYAHLTGATDDPKGEP